MQNVSIKIKGNNIPSSKLNNKNMTDENFQIQIKNLVCDAAFRSDLYSALTVDFGEHFTLAIGTESLWVKIIHHHGATPIKDKMDNLFLKYIGDINFFVIGLNPIKGCPIDINYFFIADSVEVCNHVYQYNESVYILEF